MKKIWLIILLIIVILIGIILTVVKITKNDKQDDYDSYINPRDPWQNTVVEKELFKLYAQKEWQYTTEYDYLTWDSNYDNTSIGFSIVWNKIEYSCSKKFTKEDYVEDCIGEVEYNDLTRKLYKLSNISDEYAIAIYYDEEDKYIVMINKNYEPESVKDMLQDIGVGKENTYIASISVRTPSQEMKDIQYKKEDAKKIVENNFLNMDNKLVKVDFSSDYANRVYITSYSEPINDMVTIILTVDGELKVRVLQERTYKFECSVEETVDIIQKIMNTYEGYILTSGIGDS